MSIVLIVFGIFILMWLLGVGVAAYHVFKYGLPGDATKTALWVFLGFAALVFLVVIYFISGINWSAV